MGCGRVCGDCCIGVTAVVLIVLEIALIVGLLFSGIIMIGVGAACIDVPTRPFCTGGGGGLDRGGAIALVVVGCLLEFGVIKLGSRRRAE